MIGSWLSEEKNTRLNIGVEGKECTHESCHLFLVAAHEKDKGDPEIGVSNHDN